MSSFSVEPEALRTAAKQLADALQGEPPPRWPVQRDLGNQDLNDTAQSFARNVARVWSTRIEEFDEVVARLRASADAYEQADEDGVAR